MVLRWCVDSVTINSRCHVSSLFPCAQYAQQLECIGSYVHQKLAALWSYHFKISCYLSTAYTLSL